MLTDPQGTDPTDVPPNLPPVPGMEVRPAPAPAPTPTPKRKRGRPRKATAPTPPAAGGPDRAALDTLAKTLEPAPSTRSSIPAKHRTKVTKDELLATIDKLDRRVAELTAQVGTTLTDDKVAGMVSSLAGALSEMASKLTKVPDVALTPEERDALGAGVAPALAPLMAQHGDKAPWAVAVLTLATVGWRPVMAYLDAKAERERLALPVPPAEVVPSAPREVAG